MSGPIAEEDVLAVLLIRACQPIVTDWNDPRQILERRLYDGASQELPWIPAQVAIERRLGHADIEEAIADSERRLDVERAREAVLDAAEQWCRDWEHCLPGVIPDKGTDAALFFRVRSLRDFEGMR